MSVPRNLTSGGRVRRSPDRTMALKKSGLYSSVWSSCDELRGGMDASQYKDYVLVLLFIRYVSDKYAGVPYAPIKIPAGASFRCQRTRNLLSRLDIQNFRFLERGFSSLHPPVGCPNKAERRHHERTPPQSSYIPLSPWLFPKHTAYA
jgi:HsdM N-terminal domain